MSRPIVHTVWIEGPLPELARMALASYERHGCEVHLWTYETSLLDTVIHGAPVHTASRLIPRPVLEAFRYKDGRLTLAGDVIGWWAVHEFGGWSGHLDVTLMKPLDALDAAPYVFAPHHRFSPVFSLWKAPAKSPLTWNALADVFTNGINPNDWHSTMAMFSRHFHALGLQKHLNGYVNNDSSEDPIERMTRAGSELPEGWDTFTAIHWMGSGRIRGLNIHPDSYFARLRKDLLG